MDANTQNLERLSNLPKVTPLVSNEVKVFMCFDTCAETPGEKLTLMVSVCPLFS